ncbi:MAG: SRPBCC domain-containing protein [Aeromicrobium sp.]
MTVDQQPRKVTMTTPTEREIRFERIFNAPRNVVWKAFTDPTLIAEWWGGGTTVEHMDVRPGGSWKFIAEGAGQGNTVFQGEYLEVDPPSRIVQTFDNGWMPGPIHTETMVFEDLGGSTRFTMTSVFATTERRDELLQTAEQGANYTYGKLDQLLARLS